MFIRGGFIALALALPLLPAGAQQPRREHWKVDGLDREGLVFAPSSQSPNGKAPLIIALHGHGGAMRGFANTTHFQTAWPEAIVVYLQGLPIVSKLDPSGKKAGWDAGESARPDKKNRDIDFVDSVLATTRRDFPVDDNRIYVTGFSNGAHMTFLLWAARSSVFAAIAPVAGAIRDWKPATPRPVIYIAGKKDPLVKPEIQKETLASVLAIDNATGASQACGPGCTFHPSTGGTPVRSISHDGGHEFPPFATEAIVAFFKNHQRRP